MSIISRIFDPVGAICNRFRNGLVSYFRRTFLTIFITLSSLLIGYSQEVKVSVTNYEGTTKKKVEYQYITGKQAKASDIEYRDGQTGILKAVDQNTYSVSQMVPHGYWKEYFENGKLKAQFNYEQGHRVGAAKTFYENGSVEKSFTYKNGIIDGEFSEYYDNGKLQAKCRYENGSRVSNNTINDFDGNPILYISYESTEIQRTTSGGQKTVVKVKAQSKHPNGKVAQEGYLNTYYSREDYLSYYDEDFRREGIWTEYDENGIKVSTTTYSNNYPDGLYMTYYPSGAKQEEKYYRPQVYVGQKISVIDGPYKSYYESGETAKTGTMKTIVTKSKTDEGQLETEEYNTGDWRRFDQSGKMVEFMAIENGTDVICEMNEFQIAQQQTISDNLELTKFKSASVDKFTKYIRFHYGEKLDSFDAVSSTDSQMFEEIKKAAIGVYNEYLNSLKGCTDKECVTGYSNKMDNVLNKLYEVTTKRNFVTVNQSMMQYGIKQALKI